MPTPSTDETAAFEEARADLASLLGSFLSVHLATVDPGGEPNASYAPALIDDGRNFYVYVSALAGHTENLRRTARASVLVIEDETLSAQIFARKRASFSCDASLIERHSESWEARLDDFTDKFGNLVKRLRKMEDFQLFLLAPRSGRLVTGFGRAFDVYGPAMREVRHVGGTGRGHITEKRGEPAGKANP